MLPKSMRLDLRSKQSQLKNGRTRHSPFFRMLSIPSSEFRAAIVVSARIAPTAIERNHIKRQVRSILQSQKDQIPSLYLFIVKPAALHATYEQLTNDIRSLLAK